MDQEYSTRALQADDLVGISRVHYRACRIAFRVIGWSYTEDEVLRWYATKLSDWDWGRVVLCGGEVVAYIAAIRAHIDQLFVDPDHQRLGLGRTLLTVMLDRQLRPATLTVFAENAPARSLYERFGFREVGAWWNKEDRAVELLYRLE